MSQDIGTRIVRAVLSLVITAGLVVALVLWLPSEAYLWVKAVHIMAVISWMAGMFYLPRLFVYHCSAEPGSVQSETFKVMERRLLTQIINPAMVVSWALGLWMAWDRNLYAVGWFQAKLVLVVLLSGLHGYLAYCVRQFAYDQNRKSHVFYRIINEVPTVLMIGIVLLTVFKAL